MKLYVGNISYAWTEENLIALFVPHGTVLKARIGRNKATGQPEGYGFVDMEEEEARAALLALDATVQDGRTIRVIEAKIQPPSSVH